MWADEKLGMKVDVVNVLGAEGVTEVNEVGDLSPDGTRNPNYLSPTAFQDERVVRFSVTYDW